MISIVAICPELHSYKCNQLVACKAASIADALTFHANVEKEGKKYCLIGTRIDESFIDSMKQLPVIPSWCHADDSGEYPLDLELAKEAYSQMSMFTPVLEEGVHKNAIEFPLTGMVSQLHTTPKEFIVQNKLHKVIPNG